MLKKLQRPSLLQVRIISIVIFLNAIPILALPQAGALDSSFGVGGKIITPFDGARAYCSSISLLDDGKIMIAGIAQRNDSRLRDMILAKYETNGRLDTSFGLKGKVITSFKESSTADAMIVQKDRKILVAGKYSWYGAALVRFNQNGSLDTSFGDSGLVITQAEGYYGDHFNSLARQSDGKILAAGFVQQSGDDSSHTLLVRYLPDGSPDSSFGNNGILIGSSGKANAMVIQKDDKILLAGQESKGSADNRFRFLVKRYNSDGSRDKDFGNNGKASIQITSYSEAHAIALQDDGKILLAGQGNSAVHFPGSDFALVRLLSNGNLDKTFGNEGKVTTTFEGSGKAFTIKLQDNGKVVVAGYAGTKSAGSHFALARYNSYGELDTSFGTTGMIVSTTKHYSLGSSLAIQNDGRILLGGQTDTSGSNNTSVTLLRFIGDEALGQNEHCCKQGVLHVYPNPITQTPKVYIKHPFKDGRLILFNAQGQILITKNLSDQEFGLEIDNLTNGIYLIQATNHKGSMATQTLVISR